MDNSSLLDSLKVWLQEKNNSSVYFTFILTVLTWNWKFFYALFFVSDSSLNGVKSIDYALSVSHLFQYPLTAYDYSFINQITLAICNFASFFFVPSVATFIMIWYIPYINVLAHRKGLSFYFIRKSEYDSQKSLYLNKKESEATKQITTLKKIEEQADEKNKIEKSIKSKQSPEEKLEEEIIDFEKNTVNIEALKRANEIVYAQDGYYNTDRSDNYSRDRFIEPLYLSKLDIYGLITWVGNGSKIEFTEKGKRFLKYLNI